jgi:hypothetical protein
MGLMLSNPITIVQIQNGEMEQMEHRANGNGFYHHL